MPEGIDSFIHKALLAVQDPAARQSVLILYLQETVARALKVAPEQIAAEHPLTAFGVDSLAAIEVKNEIETALQVEVPLVALLQGPSLAQLAVEIIPHLGKPREAVLTPAAEPRAEYPLSYGQQALWFLYQLAPESAAYNIPCAVRIRSELDVAALQRALEKLAVRHAVLRTTFALTPDGPVQHIHPRLPLDFERREVMGWSEAELSAHLNKEANRPFDLGRGPLLRVHVFRRSAQDYVLLWVMHHIIGDFWSLAVLVQELAALYPAERAGQVPDLPPLTLQYTDYARWQKEMLAGPRGDALRAYWQGQLAGEIPVLHLPTDHPRPPVQTFRGNLYTTQLGSELTRQLKALSRVSGATMNTILLAAFETLLYRYTGQSDFYIGSLSAGRDHAELADLAGYFVNPLVLRTRLSARQTFAEFLSQTRRTLLGAFEHQNYPFSALVDQIQPPRDYSRSPLFDVLFTFQRAHQLAEQGLTAFALDLAGARMDLAGLQLESLALERRVAQFDLTLTMGEVSDGLVASFEYNADLFEATTIARWAEHFRILLEGIVTNPEQRLADLPLLSEAERRQLRVTWSGGRNEQEMDTTIQALIEAQVQRTPEAIAVQQDAKKLTYRELDARANQVAARLQALDVGPETLVGICMERTPEMIVAILGVLKAGGAYVPLDPGYPQARLGFMMQDTRATVLLTQTSLREQFPSSGARVICLDPESETLECGSHAPAQCVYAQNLACVIYTSGSTGQPKGVLLEHRGIVNLVHSFIQSYDATSTDKLLPLTSVASASFVGEILPLLAVGGTVVMPHEEQVLDPEQVCELITQQGISIVSTVPAVLAGLNAQANRLSSLRLVLSGGEALAAGDVDQLANRVAVVNGYGLTETGICSTFYRLQPQDLGASAWLPIGQPILNTQVYVLDPDLNLLPVGCPGELYIGGAGLARGYLGKPDLTAERFVPNPFVKAEGGSGTSPKGWPTSHLTGLPSREMKDEDRRQKAESPTMARGMCHRKQETEEGSMHDDDNASFILYRTGDIARWLPKGVLQYLNRVDDQVKLRGYRIELGEIETVLKQYPDVRDAFVMVREDISGTKRLVAYLVSDDRLMPGKLYGRLADKLPPYMIPSVFEQLDALPFAASGKVDVRALPAPDGQRPDLAAEFVPPQSEIERTIAAIWQGVLKLDQVGIYDNFFELGGNSLLITQVHRQLNDQLGQNLSLIDLFKYPTINALAIQLNQAHSTAPGLEKIKGEAEKRRDALERRKQLAQERMRRV